MATLKHSVTAVIMDCEECHALDIERVPNIIKLILRDGPRTKSVATVRYHFGDNAKINATIWRQLVLLARQVIRVIRAAQVAALG